MNNPGIIARRITPAQDSDGVMRSCSRRAVADGIGAESFNLNTRRNRSLGIESYPDRVPNGNRGREVWLLDKKSVLSSFQPPPSPGSKY